MDHTQTSHSIQAAAPRNSHSNHSLSSIRRILTNTLRTNLRPSIRQCTSTVIAMALVVAICISTWMLWGSWVKLCIVDLVLGGCIIFVFVLGCVRNRREASAARDLHDLTIRDKSPEDVAREQREQEQLRDFEVWARDRETAYWEDKVRKMEERRAVAAAAAATAGQSPERAPSGMP